MRILIAGCGYSGIRMASRLHADGHTVWGLRRSPPRDPSPIQWIQGDLTAVAPLTLPERLDAVVLAAGLYRDTPERYHALFIDGYERLLRQLRAEKHPLRRIVMISTTSVFAEADGGWVDETSPTAPDRLPASCYLAAEQRVSASGWSSVVLRCSGIYGPGRTRMLREAREQQTSPSGGPPQYVNHIHVDDVARAVAHVLALDRPEPLYITTDTEPADRDDVIAWIRRQLNMPAVEPATNASPTKPRRSGNKRCRCTRLTSSGFLHLYPTFREGYAAEGA